MRLAMTALALALGTPAATSLVAHVTGAAALVGHLAASLPDPATAALMLSGFGLVAGARRLRSSELAD